MQLLGFYPTAKRLFYIWTSYILPVGRHSQRLLHRLRRLTRQPYQIIIVLLLPKVLQEQNSLHLLLELV